MQEQSCVSGSHPRALEKRNEKPPSSSFLCLAGKPPALWAQELLLSTQPSSHCPKSTGLGQSWQQVQGYPLSSGLCPAASHISAVLPLHYPNGQLR